MKKKLKSIPHFKSERAERIFWQSHDSTDYVDYSAAQRVQFPNLKLTTRPVTMRLPEHLIIKVKLKAHQVDVPYQALIKQYIFEGVQER